MPVRISAWACAFRCGRIATKANRLVGHERTCFLNPARRACPTCRHEGGYNRERECRKDVDLGEKDVRFNCDQWEANPSPPPR